MEQVSFELIRRVRLHIERTEKQVLLLEKQKEWLKLTAALDVLEDSSYAIEYYSNSIYPDDIRGKYLFSYGLLQALFLQQDAINGISEALFGNSIDYKNQYPKAYAVREIRNDVVGHPTNRSGKQYIYLVQTSLGKESFNYLKHEHDREKVESITVDVFDAISDTGNAVNTILNNSLDELDNEFKNFIEEHRERKMKDIFNLLEYARQKVFENTEMRSWGYDKRKDMVTKCEEELIQRFGSMSATDSYQYLLNDIHKAYNLIDEGLPRVPRDLLPDFERSLLENLFNKIERLRSYCVETDEYFENYGGIPIADSIVKPIIIDDLSQLSE